MGLDAVDAAKNDTPVGPTLAATMYRVLAEEVMVGREPDVDASRRGECRHGHRRGDAEPLRGESNRNTCVFRRTAPATALGREFPRPPHARTAESVENQPHAEVCAGDLTLAEAQAGVLARPFSGAVLASALTGSGVYRPPLLFGGSYGSRSSSSCLAARAAREATSALLSSSRAAARSLSSFNRGLETARMSGLS